MIVRMKHLDLVCVASEQDAALEGLRELGAVHLDLGRASGAEVTELKGEIAEAEKAVRLVLSARKDCASPVTPASVRPDEAAGLQRQVLEKAAEIETLAASADAVERLVKKYAPYGDFDPELAKKLLAAGVDLASVVELPDVLPEKRLGAYEADLESIRGKIAALRREIASADEKAIAARFPALADRLAFGAARELLSEHGAVATVEGWIPETRVDDLRGVLSARGWGVLLRDPVDGELPPTLIEPPKMFRPMKSLFQGLGISPAYSEADVSVPFMCYFSLFFAMLVGDGAYGAIFLAGTLAARKALPKSWFVLLTVFSSATVAWGVLSNTWFGAGIPFLANLPTVTWLADPSYNNMMLLCFTIGVSHLMLARIWNGVCRLPDTTALAEFGWAGVLLMMYLVTNTIVGIFPSFPSWGLAMGGVSILLVFLFTVKPSELKTRGAELGMLPLNIMSALGDIISYVRLFAVGLASVKVAENFNGMALDFVRGDGEWWTKILPALATVTILLLGHGLNIVMAALSILVHAVRLNTLEFSNHKGITWSGYAFRAFSRRANDA